METRSAYSRLSPEAKKNQQAYRNKHYSVVGASLPRERADAFRAYCAAQGKTVSAVLADYIYSIVGREPDAAPTEKTGSTKKPPGADAGNQTDNQDQPQPAENDTPGTV